jgi:hypothetical protein
VNALFGSSTNTIFSQVETEILAPIVSSGSVKVSDIQTIDKYSHRRGTLLGKENWDTLLSSTIKPFRYSLFGNQTSMDDQEDHNHVRHDEGE